MPFVSRLLLALIAACSLSCAIGFSAEITAERSADGVVIKIDGQLFTEYLVRSGGKPALWPILGPTGKRMTRDYPMLDHAGEAKDHPHHRSLWFTHGEVNGENFWLEGDKAGTIAHQEFLTVASGKPAIVATRNDWLAKGGEKVCEDRRTLRFDSDGDARWIDFDITITATGGPVIFGDTKEGTFGMRVAESMCVDAKRGGRIVNSRQQVDADAWGQAAPWVDYHGPVEGQTVGIAIFNHPSSFRFPTCWHVRTYGLFAANPFGLHDFTRAARGAGDFTLSAGKSVTFRYRVLLHRGDEKEGKVAEAFAAYSKDVR